MLEPQPLSPAMQTAVAMSDAFFGRLNERGIPDVPRMIIDAQVKSKQLARLTELSALSDFIGDASLLECKLIINELTDRVSTLTGCADKLEDAACALTKEIEAEAV
jgi:hypothetical protein